MSKKDSIKILNEHAESFLKLSSENRILSSKSELAPAFDNIHESAEKYANFIMNLDHERLSDKSHMKDIFQEGHNLLLAVSSMEMFIKKFRMSFVATLQAISDCCENSNIEENAASISSIKEESQGCNEEYPEEEKDIGATLKQNKSGKKITKASTASAITTSSTTTEATTPETVTTKPAAKKTTKVTASTATSTPVTATTTTTTTTTATATTKKVPTKSTVTTKAKTVDSEPEKKVTTTVTATKKTKTVTTGATTAATIEDNSATSDETTTLTTATATSTATATKKAPVKKVVKPKATTTTGTITTATKKTK